MSDISRRAFLKKSAGLSAAAATTLTFPAILHAKNKYPTIKVLGTHVTLQEEIRLKAQKDLGINIEFFPGGSAEVMLKASLNPGSFDIYEQWSNSIRPLWEADAIQAIDIKKLTYWDEINALSKTGRISPDAKIGAGDAPNKVLFIQEDGSLGSTPTQEVSFMPYLHNVDSFGYNSAVIPKGIPYETESWGWLLDEKNFGRVALVNEPTIGIFDAALAVEAKGLMTFTDIGDMSRAEIDRLFEILIDYKKKGHFRGVWSSVPHSIELMANNEVDIESMFSPAVSTLNGRGVPCVYAAPKEGYRAWHGVQCLSSACEGERKDAAYQYMNWWLSGWAGAFVARQGYYISNPHRSRKQMSEAEWDYWYEGKAALTDLKGTDGKVSIQKGEMRRGGSYLRRHENIAVWNTVMPNYDYTLNKWNEFVLTR
jgi:putative spermidine/putrescine transport system substrate-binding protein